MSSFKDQLNQNVLTKADLHSTFVQQLDNAISVTFNRMLDEALQRIKDDILSKSKNTDYNYVCGMKQITGSCRLPVFSHRVTPSPNTQALFIVMRNGVDIEPYLRNHKNLSVHHCAISDECIIFGYELVKKVEHTFPFIKTYYSYHLTDIAKDLLVAIESRAADEDIGVSFKGINLSSDWYDPDLIQDGDNDSAYNVHGRDGHICLEYSIFF